MFQGDLSRVTFKQQTINDFAAENLAVFDLLLICDIMHHIPWELHKEILMDAGKTLKPGGYLYIVVPNYGSFWEGHYGIFWIPYLPKFLAKIYVRLWSKKPYALSEYQLVNQVTLEIYIINLPLKVHGWGNELFIQKVQNLSISGGTLGSAKKILRIIFLLAPICWSQL